MNATQIDLSPQILILIDHLAAQRDANGLLQLHEILSRLVMSNIIDEKSSFIDLAEYIASVMDAIGTKGDPYEYEQAKKLRALIDDDFKDVAQKSN